MDLLFIVQRLQLLHVGGYTIILDLTRVQLSVFKGCPGRGANTGSFDFHLFSLKLAAL